MKNVAKLFAISTIAVALGGANIILTTSPAEAGPRSTSSNTSRSGSAKGVRVDGYSGSNPRSTTRSRNTKGTTKGLSGTDLGSGR